MSTDFVAPGVAYAKDARAADDAGNIDEALRLYTMALDYFMSAIKYAADEGLKKTLRARAAEYLARAEQLSQQLSETAEQGSTLVSQRGAASTSGVDDSKERERMRTEAARTLLQERPNVRWTDVVGLADAKQALREVLELPVRFPQLFHDKRQPWRGILLYGPPGTGKSFLAQAAATETEAAFFSVSSADLISKWQGESEQKVRALFEMARERRPSIVFIDEIDSMLTSRESSSGQSESEGRVKTEFMVQLNGLGNDMSGVLVMAATNLPWALDTAILRRFNKHIYVPLPDTEARLVILRKQLEGMSHALSEEDFEKLALATEGYSGSDLANVAREALMLPIRNMDAWTHYRTVPAENPEEPPYWTPCGPEDADAQPLDWAVLSDADLLEPSITLVHFATALNSVRPTVRAEDVKHYLEWKFEQ